MDRGINMLSVGNKVFIPNYGAGIIDNIEFRKVYDTIYKFIDIKIMIDKIYLSIPFSRVEAYRIREIVTAQKLQECFEIIKQKPEKLEKKWSRRYRENNDKLSSGSLEKECEVLRDLYLLKKEGIMPPGEQKILSKAEDLVASEAMLILVMDIENIYEIIRGFALK
jgi:CarD family transcriptional regulator